MAKIYNFDSGRLVANYRNIVSFNLDIRKPITQIYGDSATGKTLLVNFIRNEKRNSKFNAGGINDLSNIFVFDDIITESDLSDIKNSLIVIDRCDLILSLNIVDFIVEDKSNNYLLFSRTSLPLGLSPNYYGEFVHDFDNNIIISYKYSEVSWF